MQIFLDRFADTLAKDEHAVMVLDGAGWHTAKALRVPPNVTLAPLPPYAPQLIPRFIDMNLPPTAPVYRNYGFL
jgi:hypothetical protein